MRWFMILKTLKYSTGALILCILPYLLVKQYTNIRSVYGQHIYNDNSIAKRLSNLTFHHIVTEEKCEMTIKYKEVSLVVGVLSKADNFERRTTIRQTWALTVSADVLVVFTIGMKSLNYGVRSNILKENRQHADLVFLHDYQEAYDELTEKVVQTFICISERIKFDYLLKVDDDTFVRLNKFRTKLESQPMENLYWGYFNSNSPIVKKGQWEEKKSYDHICKTYVTYALGGGYVLSRDLVLYIIQNSDKLIMFTNEDVAIGTWLAPLEINRVHDDSFRMSGDCNEKHIVLHYASEKDMKDFSNNLLVSGTLCGNRSNVAGTSKVKIDANNTRKSLE